MIVIDFETTGLNFWEPDFKVISMAWAQRDPVNDQITTSFTDDPETMRVCLMRMEHEAIWVHNASFELGILKYVFPDVPLKILGDTMRLIQLFDGGGIANQLGLKASAKRILGPAKGDWEKPVHDWILKNVPGSKQKGIGAHLWQAPKDLLEAYNRADVQRTLELLEHILIRFEVAKYDYRQDMELYLYMVDRFVDAKAHGIPVDRPALEKYVSYLAATMQEIDSSFQMFFQNAVKEATSILHAKEQSRFKKKVVTEIPKFNPGSTKHLEYLFCEVLKMVPRITTPKGRPCFKTKYLAQWGDGGRILAGRSKAQFTRAQSLALLERSARQDARWHPDLSPGTTVTGRNKTYGGLNILALDRRDKGFMQTLLADEGQTLISIDLVAGEPTVVANFSGDLNYRWATIDGVGKRPHWDDHGVLKIDDIYLMFTSVTPVGRKELSDFDPEEWMKDPEVVKTKFKRIRTLHKTAALGLSYTMGVKKLQKTFFENGHDYDETVCKEIYDAYWALFANVKQYSDYLAAVVSRNKCLINPFGFRCYPNSPRLAFNYFCQSTVNGLMAVLTNCIEERAPWARLITVIHDEDIYSIPSGREEEFKGLVDDAVKDMNDAIRWDVKIRTGFATGRNFYEAK